MKYIFAIACVFLGVTGVHAEGEKSLLAPHIDLFSGNLSTKNCDAVKGGVCQVKCLVHPTHNRTTEFFQSGVSGVQILRTERAVNLYYTLGAGKDHTRLAATFPPDTACYVLFAKNRN